MSIVNHNRHLRICEDYHHPLLLSITCAVRYQSVDCSYGWISICWNGGVLGDGSCDTFCNKLQQQWRLSQHSSCEKWTVPIRNQWTNSICLSQWCPTARNKPTRRRNSGTVLISMRQDSRKMASTPSTLVHKKLKRCVCLFSYSFFF